MRLIITSFLLAAVTQVCAAADYAPMFFGEDFQVERMPFGSGTPASGYTIGSEAAGHVVDGLYHIPNYLPGHPTAATIWPREVPIECEQDAVTGELKCGGYRVHPAIGRGEYIFIRPVSKAQQTPVVIEQRPTPASCDCVADRPEPPKPLPMTRKKPLG
ncbi:hypothetical protein [Noviherbaspirillum saxi]|uniref:hypothetical protein n=1 Tax=Noviherbaspirillum saxi TaxID=2320863 RepID=UPI0011C48E63|nr:hypothetical protein [Noviherbaspirillum saxi]